MKWLSVALISLLMWLVLFSLAGCTETHKPNKDRVVAVIDLVDTLPPRVLGTAKTIKGVCKVQILKSNYPLCLTHELMHCFEGSWHKGYDTTRLCD